MTCGLNSNTLFIINFLLELRDYFFPSQYDPPVSSPNKVHTCFKFTA